MKKTMALLMMVLLACARVSFAAPSFSFYDERYVLENEITDSAILDTVPLQAAASAPWGEHYYLLRTYVLEGETAKEPSKQFDVQYLVHFDDEMMDDFAHEMVSKIESAGLVGGGGLYCGGGMVLSWEEPHKFVIERLVSSNEHRRGKIVRFVYQDKPKRFEQTKNTLVEDPFHPGKEISLFEAWRFDICNLKV